jgi:ubiquinone/menaquinone biosynthesis C-methylase UbiE
MGFMQDFHAQFGKPTGFWGHLAGWIMAYRRSNRERGKWTLSLLDLQPGDRVLEIGFGPGVAIKLASRIASEGLVVGLDHSAAMLAQARRRNAAAIREGRVDLRLGSVSDLPAFDEPFDKIFAINSIGFWAEPAERLKELRLLLRPGGTIAITTQPRSRGATDETAQQTGRETADALRSAGFSRVRLETRPMKPVSAVCVLGSD